MYSESTHNLVLEVLQRASSQNPEILKTAEEQLKTWEVQSGFHSVLYTVLSDHSIDINVRWIAVLYLKNGIDKYWRKNAPGAIIEEEKEYIRLGLLSSFNEPISQIALQRAVLISKIARYDFPKEWSQLFPTLLQAVENPENIVQHRALLTLHHVVKAIATKRLLGDRMNFQNLTSNIFMFILNMWNTLTDSFVRETLQNGNTEVVTIYLEKALLCLRVLRKLAVFGFYKPHTNEECMTFMNGIFEKAKNVLQCRKQMKARGEVYLTETMEKFIVHLTKVLLTMLDIHPYSFVDLIQPSLEFTNYYLFTNDGIQFLYERFVIQCFNLIKNILLCTEYVVAKTPDSTRNPDVMKAYRIEKDFFKPEILRDICRKLVTHYFILTQDELMIWDSDPELFSNDESGDSWKYSLRPSVETVFATIFHEFRDVLRPFVLELIQETNVIVSPDDMQGILKKDAVYNAVTLCSFDLYDEVDFNHWFRSTLLQELKIKHNNYRVIRRRVSSLVGRWVGIQLATDLRPIMYECIIDLLEPGEDMAVRLTASVALRNAVDDFEFDGEQFKDYLFQAFNLLFRLLKDGSECETKMQVLSVIMIMLERMGQSVTPYSDPLIQYLPHLWAESEEHNMLRCAIVNTLVQLVKAFGGTKPELTSFLLPIVHLGTDTTQSAIVYLLEDCLDLWFTVLEYSTVMTPELLQLFSNMPLLLDYSTENLEQCLTICFAQVLLAPEITIRQYGLQIITMCDSLMSDLKNEGIILIMRLVETLIKISPQMGIETAMPILPRIFQNIYSGDAYPMVMSMYIGIFSRVLLASHDVFSRVLSTLASTQNETDQVTLSKILDVVLKGRINVWQMEYDKLLGLALCNFLTTQSRPVLERFPTIIVSILETLNDISKQDEVSGEWIDSLILTDGQSPSRFDDDSEGYYQTDHDQRKKKLILNDPVYTTILKDYLQSQLIGLKNQLGDQPYQQLVESIDADSIQQLKEYIVF